MPRMMATLTLLAVSWLASPPAAASSHSEPPLVFPYPVTASFSNNEGAASFDAAIQDLAGRDGEFVFSFALDPALPGLDPSTFTIEPGTSVFPLELGFGYAFGGADAPAPAPIAGFAVPKTEVLIGNEATFRVGNEHLVLDCAGVPKGLQSPGSCLRTDKSLKGALLSAEDIDAVVERVKVLVDVVRARDGQMSLSAQEVRTIHDEVTQLGVRPAKGILAFANRGSVDLSMALVFGDDTLIGSDFVTVSETDQLVLAAPGSAVVPLPAPFGLLVGALTALGVAGRRRVSGNGPR